MQDAALEGGSLGLSRIRVAVAMVLAPAAMAPVTLVLYSGYLRGEGHSEKFWATFPLGMAMSYFASTVACLCAVGFLFHRKRDLTAPAFICAFLIVRGALGFLIAILFTSELTGGFAVGGWMALVGIPVALVYSFVAGLSWRRSSHFVLDSFARFW